MTTARERGCRPAVFVAQLHRAAAQRGKLDPVYQELSDHWTAILQRLYPVWALIGPGLVVAVVAAAVLAAQRPRHAILPSRGGV